MTRDFRYICQNSYIFSISTPDLYFPLYFFLSLLYVSPKSPLSPFPLSPYLSPKTQSNPPLPPLFLSPLLLRPFSRSSRAISISPLLPRLSKPVPLPSTLAQNPKARPAFQRAIPDPSARTTLCAPLIYMYSPSRQSFRSTAARALLLLIEIGYTVGRLRAELTNEAGSDDCGVHEMFVLGCSLSKGSYRPQRRSLVTLSHSQMSISNLIEIGYLHHLEKTFLGGHKPLNTAPYDPIPPAARVDPNFAGFEFLRGGMMWRGNWRCCWCGG